MKKNHGLKLFAMRLSAFLVLVACSFFLIERHLKFEREEVAINHLHRIHQAQMQFKTKQGRYGTLAELAEARLVEAGPAYNATSYFRYWVSDLTPTTFCAHADRKGPKAGYCDFNLSEDGVLYSRCSDNIGPVPRGQGLARSLGATGWSRVSVFWLGKLFSSLSAQSPAAVQRFRRYWPRVRLGTAIHLPAGIISSVLCDQPRRSNTNVPS